MIGKQHSISSSYLKSCQSLVMRLTRKRRYYLKYPHILNMSSSYKIYSCHIVKYHKFSMFYSPYKMPSCYICRIQTTRTSTGKCSNQPLSLMVDSSLITVLCWTSAFMSRSSERDCHGTSLGLFAPQLPVILNIYKHDDFT